MLGFLHSGEQADLAGRAVGKAQIIITAPGDRAPQAVADRQFDVILGGPHHRRPIDLGGIAGHKRGEIVIQYRVEALARPGRDQGVSHYPLPMGCADAALWAVNDNE